MKRMIVETNEGYTVKIMALKSEPGAECYEVSTEGLLRPSCSIWFENEEEMLFFADAINEFVEANGIADEKQFRM